MSPAGIIDVEPDLQYNIQFLLIFLKTTTNCPSHSRDSTVFVGITQVEIDPFRVESPLPKRGQSAQAQPVATHAAAARPKHFL